MGGGYSDIFHIYIYEGLDGGGGGGGGGGLVFTFH